MPSRRTIRKPTVWAPRRVAPHREGRCTRGVPPLRYVREAALVAELLPVTQRRGAHALLHELKRVLINLHQLHRLAAEDGARASRSRSKAPSASPTKRPRGKAEAIALRDSRGALSTTVERAFLALSREEQRVVMTALPTLGKFIPKAVRLVERMARGPEHKNGGVDLSLEESAATGGYPVKLPVRCARVQWICGLQYMEPISCVCETLSPKPPVFRG
jgi:hypothetical protein